MDDPRYITLKRNLELLASAVGTLERQISQLDQTIRKIQRQHHVLMQQNSELAMEIAILKARQNPPTVE